MPPLLTADERTHEEAPALSDEDISILHNIVLRAEQNNNVHTRPKRTLFDAYDAEFAERALDTIHDRACLRTLLQLAAPDAAGSNLYEKFERLLAGLGIELITADDNSSAPAGGLNATNRNSEPVVADHTRELPVSPRWLERRNSFTSMYDVTTGLERSAQKRRWSRASVSHVQATKPTIEESGNANRSAVIRRRTRADPLHTSIPPESRLSARRHQWNETGGPRGTIDSPQESLAIYEDSDADHESIAVCSDQEQFVQYAVPISDTQLIRDSGAFDQGRIQILSKRFLKRWALKMRQLQGFELEADQKDRTTLVRQSFDTWVQAHARNKQEEWRAQYLNVVGARATEIYNSRLKEKAFHHWYQVALEATSNTHAATKKYLAVKYFNTWHRLTVTNELKAEQQRLRPSLRQLSQRAARFYQDEIDAIELHHTNLTKLVFWRWLLVQAEENAARHQARNLARKAFMLWTAKLAQRDLAISRADRAFHCSISNHILGIWTRQTRLDVAGNQEADSFRGKTLLKVTLSQWQTEHRLSPLAERVVRMRDWRIARTNFSVWLLRIRMVFRADSVSKLRTEQNAFTAWNDQLRIKTLQARMNNRVIAEAMYKWVIEQRLELMTRVRQEKSKRTTLRQCLTAFRNNQDLLHSSESRMFSRRSRNLKYAVMERWKLQANLARERSQKSIEFYAPKVEEDALSAWRGKTMHIQNIEKWATDASYYFRTVKSLKSWRRSAVEAKKKRLNEAYKKVRRDVKMSLARRSLVLWQTRLRNTDAMDAEGEQAVRAREAVISREYLRRWQFQSSERRRVYAEAAAKYDDRLTQGCLEALSEALKQAQTLQGQADQFFQIRLSEICSAQLRKLSMKAFEVMQRFQSADAMRDRHWAKHRRNMLRHWSLIAREKSYQALVEAPLESNEPELTDAGYGTASQSDVPGESDKGHGRSGQPEEWSAFDADLPDDEDWRPSTEGQLQQAFTPIPTPGYLNTPSKRAARAKALAKMSATPATPLVTPFSARLRAGVSHSPFIGTVFYTKRGIQERSDLGEKVVTARKE